MTGVLLAVGGVFCAALGFLAYGSRQAIAATFLGADFLFGVPVTRDDSWKVLLVGGESILAILGGVLLILSGLVIAWIRVQRAQGAERSAAPVPFLH
jgi:hypothetical protein